MSYVQVPDRSVTNSSMYADVNQLQDNIEAVKGGTGSSAPTMTLEQVITAMASYISLTAINGYINGLNLSNNSGDVNNDIDIATGACLDSTNAYVMALSSIMTKRLDASWAVGTGNGGLFTGSKGASTWYYVFLIRKDSDGSIDAGFDTSVTAANKPAGYTAYRRIGAILTSAGSSIIAFYQYGNKIFWKTPISVTISNPGTSAVLVTISAPPLTIAQCGFNLDGNYAGGVYFNASSPSANDVAPSSLSNSDAYMNNSTPARFSSFEMHILTNASSEIRYRFNLSSAAVLGSINVKGWEEKL